MVQLWGLQAVDSWLGCLSLGSEVACYIVKAWHRKEEGNKRRQRGWNPTILHIPST